MYLVRHCSATGQAPDAPLTVVGEQQSFELASFFKDKKITRIISSDFLRAVQSAIPLSKESGIKIELETRLRECEIGEITSDDWKQELRRCIEDPEFQLDGGEKTGIASIRGRQVIDETNTSESTVFFTHGLLLTLICRTIDPSIGFEFWEQLQNPDIVEIAGESAPSLVRKIAL